MRIIALFLIVLVSACSDDSSKPPSDNNTNNVVDMSAVDSGPDSASNTDVGASECTQVTMQDLWTLTLNTDVGVEYSSQLSTSQEISILFERYSPLPDIGTFELGQGADANFGNCAHCIFVRTDGPERAFFADAGTLVTTSDPYDRRADFEVTGLRLVEVTVDLETRESTRVADGACIEVADFSLSQAFPPPRWTCSVEAYADGQNCNCTCGEVDPDCNTGGGCLPGMPGCEERDPLPVLGCQENETCVFDPIAFTTACSSSCDWMARESCGTGTCVYEFGVGSGDLCIEDAARFAQVGVGEVCPPSNLQLFCNVNAGFSEGYCGPNNICRAICESDTECTEDGDTCRKFTNDGALGYCGPIPTDG